jgi:hypothetical protein
MAEDLRLWEFWQALKTQLDVSALQAGTGAAGRVYLATENMPTAPAGADEAGPWGRVIIQPSRVPVAIAGSPLRLVRFAVVAQVRAFRPEAGAGVYDPNRPLDTMQAVAKDRLQWWSPGGFTYLTVGFPVTRETPPAGMPDYSPELDVFWSSSVYRMEAARAAA